TKTHFVEYARTQHRSKLRGDAVHPVVEIGASPDRRQTATATGLPVGKPAVANKAAVAIAEPIVHFDTGRMKSLTKCRIAEIRCGNVQGGGNWGVDGTRLGAFEGVVFVINEDPCAVPF